MNTYFYKLGKIRYNYADPTAEKIENRYLNGIMDSGVGNCYTMPLLYQVVAQRLGYPVKFVFTPRHSFLRYDDPKLERQNIEATSYGTYHSDEYYKQWLPMKPEALKNGLYMRTLTNRELLADLIGMSAADWGRASNKRDLTDGDRIRYILKSINYLHVAEKLNPKNEQVMQDLAGSYEFLNYLETKDDFGPNYFGFPKGSLNGDVLRMIDTSERRSWAEHLATAQAYYQKALLLGLDPSYYTKKFKRDYLADIPRLKKNNELFEKKMAEGEAKLNEFMRKIASDRRNL
ncbi:MAG: hypothetical protein HY074_05475 [Deltaproteobacteria bacterium]|nr:hypothetical protein [Deltaproteobacteria bacterium]